MSNDPVTLRQTLNSLGYVLVVTFENAKPTPHFLLYQLPQALLLIGRIVSRNILFNFVGIYLIAFSLWLLFKALPEAVALRIILVFSPGLHRIFLEKEGT